MSKVILITGASTGFGNLTARALLKQGHTVYATMRDPKGKNAKHAEALSSAGAKLLELDVTQTESVQNAVADLLSLEGRLDVVVNNAGVAAMGISEAFSPEQVNAMFDVNVTGMLRVSQAVLPAMRNQHDGLIINVGSILGRVTFPFFGLYGASKYAVEALTDSLAYEVSQLGIDVALVQPSAHPTNMYANALTPVHTHIADHYGPEAEIPAAIGNTIATMFEGENAPSPSAVAETIVELVSQEKGQRAKRTVVGASFGADAANAQIEPIQSGLMGALQLTNLESVKV